MASKASTIRNGLDAPTTLATALITGVALVILGGAVGILMVAGQAISFAGSGFLRGRRASSRPCGLPTAYPARTLGGRPLCRGCGRFLGRCSERVERRRAAQAS